MVAKHSMVISLAPIVIHSPPMVIHQPLNRSLHFPMLVHHTICSSGSQSNNNCYFESLAIIQSLPMDFKKPSVSGNLFSSNLVCFSNRFSGCHSIIGSFSISGYLPNFIIQYHSISISGYQSSSILVYDRIAICCFKNLLVISMCLAIIRPQSLTNFLSLYLSNFFFSRNPWLSVNHSLSLYHCLSHNLRH